MLRTPLAWFAAIVLTACAPVAQRSEPLACPQQVACPACPVCPPAKPAPETAFYEETAFSVLPGWSTNRVQPSLRTFVASCPRPGALARVCELARSVSPDDEAAARQFFETRSEEHTSELQSPCNLVCRLLLEKKKITT